jgi:hypothetical protein
MNKTIEYAADGRVHSRDMCQSWLEINSDLFSSTAADSYASHMVSNCQNSGSHP